MELSIDNLLNWSGMNAWSVSPNDLYVDLYESTTGSIVDQVYLYESTTGLTVERVQLYNI